QHVEFPPARPNPEFTGFGYERVRRPPHGGHGDGHAGTVLHRPGNPGGNFFEPPRIAKARTAVFLYEQRPRLTSGRLKTCFHQKSLTGSAHKSERHGRVT